MPRCIKLNAPYKLSYEERAPLVPEADEAVINMRLAAICGSDYSLYTGHLDVPLPVVPGHEGVGIVAAVGGKIKHIKPGDKVVLNPNVACDNCELCKSGMRNTCSQKVRTGIDTDGVFGDQVKIRANYVYPVPDSLPDEYAALVEPYAVVMHAANKVQITPGQKVLIIGGGSMGLMLVQLMLRQNNMPVCYDLAPQKARLSEDIGAVGVSDMSEAEREGPFNVIFEASGSSSGLDCAVKLAAPGASIVVIGLPATPHPVSSNMIARKELRILGSIIYVDEFPEVISMLMNKEVDPSKIISGSFAYEDLARAFENFQQPDRIKMLVRIE